MFKKLLLLALAVVVMASPVFAAQTQTKIIDTKLTKEAGEAIGSSLYVGDADKVSFFVTYQSSSATGAVTASISAEASLNGVSWAQIYWIDEKGNVTNTFTMKNSGVYEMWFPREFTMPQMRITVNATNYSTYDFQRTADISVTIVEKK